MSAWANPSDVFAALEERAEPRPKLEAVKPHDRRIRKIDPYALSPLEAESYRSGEWLCVKTPVHLRESANTDRECAAELGARIAIALGRTEP